MMRAIGLLIGMLLVMVVPAAAQESRHRMGHEDLRHRAELRHRIEERFTEHAKERLRLTDEQVARLSETSRRFGGRRQEIEARARAVREALGDQLRPGVAADRDSVTKLTDAALELRVAYAETFRDELRETGKFLDPVQRAQLFAMRDRLLDHAREIRGKRRYHDWHRYRRRVGEADSGR